MPRSSNPVPQYFTAKNKILVGGLMFYFEAGTSDPKATFSDQAETIQNTHPVVLDSEGRLPNVFFTGTAKQVLEDANNVQIWERDNVGDSDTPNFNDADLQFFSTTQNMIDNFNKTPVINDIVETLGFTVEGGGGGAQWQFKGVTGQTVSQSPAQLGDALLNDGNGNQWALVKDGILFNPKSLGLKIDNSTIEGTLLQTTLDYAAAEKLIFSPSAGYSITTQTIDFKNDLVIEGPTTSASRGTTGNLNGQGFVIKYTGVVKAEAIITSNVDGAQGFARGIQIKKVRVDCGGSDNATDFQGWNEFCILEDFEVGNYTEVGIDFKEHDSGAGRFVNNQVALNRIKTVPFADGITQSISMRLQEFSRCSVDHVTADTQQFNSTGPIAIGCQILTGSRELTLTSNHWENCSIGIQIGEIADAGGNNATIQNITIIGNDVDCVQQIPNGTTVGSLTNKTIAVLVCQEVKWYSLQNIQVQKTTGISPFSYDYLLYDEQQDQGLERSSPSSTSDRIVFAFVSEDIYGNEIFLSDSVEKSSRPKFLSIERILSADDSYPSVVNGQHFRTNNASATSITGFDGSNDQQLTIRIRDANTTLEHDNNAEATKLLLAGSVDISPALNSVFTFTNYGGAWIETSRMITNNTTVLSDEVSLSVNSTYPSVSSGKLFITNNSNPTIITGFDGVNDQEVMLRIRDSNTTLEDNNNISGAKFLLAGAVDVTPTLNSIFTFINFGGVWIEKSRTII